MKIDTAFTPGGKAFVLVGPWGQSILEYTVGQVRVYVTDSPGAPEDAEIDGMPARDFDNYAPQSAFKEEIMCVETGIGSGSIYTYNEHAFTTREAAERGQQMMKARHADQIAKREAWERNQRREDAEYHRRCLARIESEAD